MLVKGRTSANYKQAAICSGQHIHLDYESLPTNAIGTLRVLFPTQRLQTLLWTSDREPNGMQLHLGTRVSAVSGPDSTRHPVQLSESHGPLSQECG